MSMRKLIEALEEGVDGVDYWRTVSNQKLGFSGTPGSGKLEVGNPKALTGFSDKGGSGSFGSSGSNVKKDSRSEMSSLLSKHPVRLKKDSDGYEMQGAKQFKVIKKLMAGLDSKYDDPKSYNADIEKLNDLWDSARENETQNETQSLYKGFVKARDNHYKAHK